MCKSLRYLEIYGTAQIRQSEVDQLLAGDFHAIIDETGIDMLQIANKWN